MKYDLIIEKLSGNAATGKVGKIKKRSGDTINPGDTIFTIESGKGTTKYVSKYKGVVEELSISEGDTIKKNQIIGKVEGELIEEDKSPKYAKKSTYSFGLAKPLPKNYEADVVVIGGGPGGYVSAIRAAQGGKKVIIIEESRLGGTCLNHGCIPTKALVSSVDVLEKIKNAKSFGLEVQDYKFSLKKIMKRKNEVVDTLVSGIEHLMKANKIEYINGKAQIKDSQTVTVQNKLIDATICFSKLIRYEKFYIYNITWYGNIVGHILLR